MIKSIIYRIIGQNTPFKIKRVIFKIKSGKARYNSTKHTTIISEGYHTSCGYYDLIPEKNGKLLFGVADKKMESYSIMLKDLKTSQVNKIDTTFAVNWQQGCRLKWLNDGSFIYNTCDKETRKYHSMQVFDGNIIKHKLPIYDANACYGVSLDFTRLGHMRPGYGYTHFQLAPISEADIALTIFDMEKDAVIKEIYYSDILHETGLNPNLKNCYVNHVSISPDGSKFLFFFVEIQNGRHMCYLMIYDEGGIKMLEDTLSASHYT